MKGITVESHRVSTDVFLGSVVHLLAVASDHVVNGLAHSKQTVSLADASSWCESLGE
jgi:hypothetical protein